MNVDNEKLIKALEKKYRAKTGRSLRLYQKAERVLVRGGSHSIRIWRPYPISIAEAKGAEVRDIDGNIMIDYWQGHYANILGHNPVFDGEESGMGESLHTGFETGIQVDLAELLLKQLGYHDHKVRFTTSGTLAAMYAVMLAMGFTGRDLILKAGGGWHGASPYLLKGIKYDSGKGFGELESSGIPASLGRNILITSYNDPADLKKIMAKKGDRIACLILEPFLGVGGFLPALREYLETARSLTRKYGAVLIFDEVISGFRFCPSGVQKFFGIEPDLSIFGKIIGGGHAVSAVAGREKIMEICEKGDGAKRVLFEGGTFSAHAGYMRAGLRMLQFLAWNADRIYPRIAESAEKLRRGIEKVCRAEGLEVKCTGYARDPVPGSSLFMVHVPLEDVDFTRPEHVWNPGISAVRMREEILKLALLVEGVHVIHGGGAVSTAHQPAHIERTIDAYAAAARFITKFRS